MICPRLRSVLLTLVVALALTGTAWAHRAPSPTEGRLTVFLVLGGTLADICDDTGESPAHAHAPDCAACRVTGGADLPAPLRLAPPVRLALPQDAPLPPVPLLARHRDNPGSPVRAPPLAA